MKTKILNSVLFRAFSVLSRRDKNRTFAVLIIQLSLAFLDLLGVFLIGMIAAIAIRNSNNQPPGDRVSRILEIVNINNFGISTQIFAVGSVAVCAFVGKTFASIYFTRRTLNFLSNRASNTSSTLIAKLLNQDGIELSRIPIHQALYAVTTGISAIMIGILGSAVTIVSDLSLLLIILFGLVFLEPMLAIVTLFFFTVTVMILYLMMHRKAMLLGEQAASLQIKSNNQIQEILLTYREAIVRNRRFFYSEKIARSRKNLATIESEIAFMPSVSKYVIETIVIVGAFLVSLIQFKLSDSSRAIATLAIFLTAGSRLAPAFLRIQQSLIQIKTSHGSAVPTLDLVDSLQKITPVQAPNNEILDGNFLSAISVERLSFTFPNSDYCLFENLSFEITEGSFVGIAGDSGVGKSTLIDLILGINKPDNGSVLISGLNPLHCFAKYPGKVAYIPQEVFMINGSIRENLTLGYESSLFSDSQIFESLRKADLLSWVSSLSEGLNTEIGERGTRLSGGQRQRLGIARALITNPALLILDEATSSLDALSENNITESIQSLRGSITVLIIAHRLSTIKDSDKILYIQSNGKVLEGKFSEIRKLSNRFNEQALLMGL